MHQGVSRQRRAGTPEVPMRPVLAVLGVILLSGAAPPDAQDAPGPRMFERLKRLVGEWEGTFEWSQGRTGSGPLRVTYSVTGGGSALVENLIQGGVTTMTTVYHLDGADLRMTHYCAARNQPRLRAVRVRRGRRLRRVHAGRRDRSGAEESGTRGGVLRPAPRDRSPPPPLHLRRRSRAERGGEHPRPAGAAGLSAPPRVTGGTSPRRGGPVSASTAGTPAARPAPARGRPAC